MTKIKNTKKGMAKKTLSMSLVVAMLATSNVPVWAAEFSDGSDVAVATEAPAEFADETEAPVVEDATEASPASAVTNEGDITTDLNVKVGTEEKNADVWGTTFTVNGTITNSKTGEALTSWKYRWVDEAGTVPAGFSGNANTANDMNLASTAKLAGKKLTLHVYDEDSNNQVLYDIDTKITVSVAKRALANATLTSKTLTYTGFSQTVDPSAITIKDEKKDTVSNSDVVVTTSSATKAGETVKVSVTAKEDSAYTGTVDATAATINKKPLASGDVIAHTTTGQTYQYTGADIEISKDKVSLVESKSSDEGADGKLSGADLSSTIKKAKLTASTAGDQTVTVIADKDKFDNISITNDADAKFISEETVKVEKRDLSVKGTKITVNTADGNLPTGINVNNVINYLTFTGTDGADLKAIKADTDEYSIEVLDAEGNKATTVTNGSKYTITITAKSGKNCTGKQVLTVKASAATLKSIEGKVVYSTNYTGSEIKPTKENLGTLAIKYYDNSGQLVTADLDPSEYEITGYSNNINATAKYERDSTSGKMVAKPTAYATIKTAEGSTFGGKTANIAFLITPLTVTDVTVPNSVAINKTYTKAEEYKVPVTVIAKDATGKKVVKTLDAADYKVDYEFVDDDINSATKGTAKNELHDKIRATVTVTNPNYIEGTTDGKTFAPTTKPESTIVAKKLTDAMVVVTPSTYTYTGGKITPVYTVVDGAIVLYKDGEVASDKAEYREVSITDAVNVGTGTIKVAGCNDLYSGTAKGTFTITAANTADVKVSIDNQNYTGKQVRPRDFKATLNGNDVSDQFEIVSYGENKEAGTGTVVLKPVDGNKNFTGSNITANFNIVKEVVESKINVYDGKGFDVTNAYTPVYTKGTKNEVIAITNDANNTFTFDGNAKTFAKALLGAISKVNDDGIKTTAKASDFEIKYADNITGKKITDGKANIGYVYAVAKDGTGFSGNKTIVTSDGTVINNVVAYLPFGIKSVEFVKKNVSLKNAVYAGGLPVKPEVLIQIGGSTLKEGTDYTIKYVDGDGKYVTPTDVTVGNIYGIEIIGKNGYTNSTVKTYEKSATGSHTWDTTLTWGVDKKNISDCTVTVKDGVTTVLNGYLPVAATEYTSKNNGDGTYTVTANSTSKNYTGSKTVKADGKAEDEKPDAPMISSVKVVGNKATVILSGDVDGAVGYDYVISTDRDCITNKDYAAVNKNQVKTTTDFTYVQQDTYYAYCHAWKRGADGKKVFSDWSNAYPFVVSAITPSQPVITSVKAKGNTVTVTYTKAANADGYDVVLGSAAKKVNGEYRPVEYGKLVKKNIKGNVVTATFKNVKKGTYYAGLHAFNKTSEDGKKVFSQWSNVKKVTVK